MSELKPCPFCGGQAFLKRDDNSYKSNPTTILDAWEVRCANDCCITKKFRDEIFHDRSGAIIINHNGAQEAIDAWNRRVGCEAAAEYAKGNRSKGGTWPGEEGEKG